MDKGEEAVPDKQDAGELRSQARRVHMRALIIAIVGTLVALALP